MTRLQDLKDLQAITQARYEQRQQSFARLVAEESRLRAELSRLDDMHHAARSPDAKADELRAIGADVIWQGWLGRTKAGLNMQLARVLSVKETHLGEVRRAYGKVLVVEELKNQIQAEHRRITSQRQLDTALNQVTLSLSHRA